MLRFFAAFTVVLFHLNQAIPHVDNWYRNTVKYGWLGVPVFFVISGYCIILSAHNSRNIKDFLCRRFFRIFPPYWFSILVVCLAACFQKLYIGSNSVQHFPQNLTGIMAMLSLTTTPLTPINTINWVYWTLTTELFFYLTVCIALLLSKTRIIYLILIVSVLATAVLPHEKNGLLFFLDQWPAFGLGVCVYYFFKEKNKLSWLLFWLLLAFNLYGMFHKYYQPEYIVAALLTTVLILISNYRSLPNNILAKLGQHSYSVYLIHVPVGVFIIQEFERTQIQQNVYINCIYDLAVYSIVALLAWLMFKYIEKPSINYGRNIAEKYFNAARKHTA